jgi:Tocopherol cyclase
MSVDGEELAFELAVAGQTHLWGKKHAYAWSWGRCAELGDSDGVLELLAVRLQRRGVTLPAMTLVSLDLDGESYRWNQFRHVLGNRGSWQLGAIAETRFSAWSPMAKLEGTLTCRADQMVNAPYLDPDGTEVFCANTEIGDARLTLWRRHGLHWLVHRMLEGRGRAHFEIGGRERAASVTREHRLVAD